MIHALAPLPPRHGHRDADACVGCHHVLVGLLNVRPSPQQIRRESGRGTRHGLLGEWFSPLDGLRIDPEQHADRILLLLDLTFQARDRGYARVERSLRARNRELRVRVTVSCPDVGVSC
ncbi:MAG TPA: hypothetical protein DEP35_04130 [Deltaproteobacteria bacterium]|nr:hypothetical protein [Deltaproteobacteria bacterium]